MLKKKLFRIQIQKFVYLNLYFEQKISPNFWKSRWIKLKEVPQNKNISNLEGSWKSWRFEQIEASLQLEDFRQKKTKLNKNVQRISQIQYEESILCNLKKNKIIILHFPDNFQSYSESLEIFDKKCISGVLWLVSDFSGVYSVYVNS